jgi:pyoverdine/dityrosine biosynthesis protein Dit1
MEIAKSELSELKKECVEAMEGQLKRHASLTNIIFLIIPQIIQIVIFRKPEISGAKFEHNVVQSSAW